MTHHTSSSTGHAFYFNFVFIILSTQELQVQFNNFQGESCSLELISVFPLTINQRTVFSIIAYQSNEQANTCPCNSNDSKALSTLKLHVLIGSWYRHLIISIYGNGMIQRTMLNIKNCLIENGTVGMYVPKQLSGCI